MEGWRAAAARAAVSVEALARELAAAPPEAVERFMASLDDMERAAAEAALAVLEREAAAREEEQAAAEWRRNPAYMAHHLTRGKLKLWRYVRLLGEKYRQAVRGESIRQIWNLPARYGKSLYGSQWGPTWQFDDDPASKLILVSYGDLLALENAVAVRQNLREHRDLLRAQLTPDRQQAGRFTTTEGGGLLAAGILSTITGFGGHGVVFDDPFKNWQEAHSAARRELIDNTYKSVVTLRLEDESSFIIVIQTRWHEDDQSGRLLARMENGTGEAWDLVRIPALAERHDPGGIDRLLRMRDPLDRAEGEPIEPERFSEPAVRARALSLGSYLCTPAETPITMADWTVKPIADVRPGDKVLGFVSESGRKRAWVPATVTETHCQEGVVADFRMESGRSIRATRDHRWCLRSGRGYQVANVGSPLSYGAPIDPEPSLGELGWWQYLAGLVDGEGCISGSRYLNLVQGTGRNAPVAAQMLECLTRLGIDHSAVYQPARHDNWQPRVMIYVTQVGRVYRTLLRHTHVAKSQAIIDALYGGAGGNERHKDRVVEISGDRAEAVYALTTTTGNYVAWGYLSSNSAALEQQRPAPEEGGEIKRAWFRVDDNLPVAADDYITSWDMKLKNKEAGDFVVGQTWARTGSSFWLVAQLRGQWNQPTTENAIALASVREPRCRLHVIENTGNGPEVATALRDPDPDYCVSDEMAELLGMNAAERAAVQATRRRGLSGVHKETVVGDKSARMRAHSGLLEAGDVHLWGGAPWLGTYLDEMASFPNGTHDDQVDATSQALKYLRGGGHATLTIPGGAVPRPPINPAQGPPGQVRRAPGGATVSAPGRRLGRATRSR